MITRKVILSIAIVGLFPFFAFSQSVKAKSSPLRFQPYVQLAKHFSTRFVIESGSRKLVSRQMPNGLEAGCLVERQLTDRFSIRSGMAVHLHFLSETNYGNMGGFPDVFPDYYRPFLGEKYSRGMEYVERVRIGIPIGGSYKMFQHHKFEGWIGAAPVISFYLPTRNEEIRNTYGLDGSTGFTELRGYEINRNFADRDRLGIFGLSRPYLEASFDFTLFRQLKKKGAIATGLRYHLGTANFGRADYVMWPQLPQYRATGHYTLNRSYIGVFLGYRFGHNSFVTANATAKNKP